MSTAINVALVLVCVGLFGCVYALLGLPMPFRTRRRERGEPICGHPFEQTWGKGVTRWTCPKCLTTFRIDEEKKRWVMVR